MLSWLNTDNEHKAGNFYRHSTSPLCCRAPSAHLSSKQHSPTDLLYLGKQREDLPETSSLSIQTLLLRECERRLSGIHQTETADPLRTRIKCLMRMCAGSPEERMAGGKSHIPRPTSAPRHQGEPGSWHQEKEEGSGQVLRQCDWAPLPGNRGQKQPLFFLYALSPSILFQLKMGLQMGCRRQGGLRDEGSRHSYLKASPLITCKQASSASSSRTDLWRPGGRRPSGPRPRSCTPRRPPCLPAAPPAAAHGPWPPHALSSWNSASCRPCTTSPLSGPGPPRSSVWHSPPPQPALHCVPAAPWRTPPRALRTEGYTWSETPSQSGGQLRAKKTWMGSWEGPDAGSEAGDFSRLCTSPVPYRGPSDILRNKWHSLCIFPQVHLFELVPHGKGHCTFGEDLWRSLEKTSPCLWHLQDNKASVPQPSYMMPQSSPGFPGLCRELFTWSPWRWLRLGALAYSHYCQLVAIWEEYFHLPVAFFVIIWGMKK